MGYPVAKLSTIAQPGSLGSNVKVVALEVCLSEDLLQIGFGAVKQQTHLAGRTRLGSDSLACDRGDIWRPCVEMVQCTRNNSINDMLTML